MTPTESLLKKYIDKCVESVHQNLKEFCVHRGLRDETTNIELEVVDLPFDKLPVKNTGNNSRLDYSWETENATVAGVPVHMYRFTAEGGEGLEAVAFAIGDTQSLIVVRNYFYTRQDQIFNTILSTFRFTPLEN